MVVYRCGRDGNNPTTNNNDEEGENMAKVFVIQENPRLNYMDAENYGEVIFITTKNYSPMKNSLINAQVLSDIATSMVNFDPDVDFLLLTGSPILIGYAFHLAMIKKGYVHILQWDGYRQSYLPIRFRPDEHIDSNGLPVL